MQGKSVFVLSAALVLLAGVVIFRWTGESQVSGLVGVNGTPIAAGSITFESDDRKLTAQISDGRYLIQHPDLAGNYKVKIDVHFVRPEEAAAFYAHITQELNQRKSDVGSSPSAIKSFEREEKLGRGANRRDFRLTE